MLLLITALFPHLAQTLLTCTYASLYSATITDLSHDLEGGCFTSVDLVSTYLARIAEVNDNLHSIIELNPDALSIATALDIERQNGAVRGPLHGIPILIKDNIATFDKMNNTAGSYALLGATVPRDSSVVAKLKSGGAIILGKANLSQWAMYRSFNSTSGWSSRGGQAYGPYYPQMDPYGSSSGSAIAAAIGLSFAALGTETRGSILAPSNKANVVGIKPSMGLTSRYLVVPITLYQDTVGPIARTVLDAATLLSVIAGVDEHDNFTKAMPNGGKLPDYVAATSKYVDLSGVRIGVPRNALESNDFYGIVNQSYVLSTFEKGLEVLRSLGAEIVDPANFSIKTHDAFSVGLVNLNNESIASRAGFIEDIKVYFSELTYNPNNLHSLVDLRNYTASDIREDYPDRDMRIFDDAIASYGNFSTNDVAITGYTAWQAGVKYDAEGGVTGICNLLNLSAMVLPTEYAPVWASSPGLPAISVPLGAYPDGTPVINGFRDLVDVAPGIPFGLTFLGKKWSEETLIGIAAAFERATGFRNEHVLGVNATVPTVEIKDILTKKKTSPNTTTATGISTEIPTSIIAKISAGSMARFSGSFFNFMILIAVALLLL